MMCLIDPPRGVVAFLAQFLDQSLTVAVQPYIRGSLDPGLLCGPGDQGIQFPLGTKPKRNRVLGNDIGNVPVRPVANGRNRRSGSADKLADRAVGNFRMVAQNPGDAIGLVLPLRPGGVARRWEERRVGKGWVMKF